MSRKPIQNAYQLSKSGPTGPTGRAAKPRSGGAASGGGQIGKSVVLAGVRATLVAVRNGAAPRTVYDDPPPGTTFDTATLELTNLSSSDLLGSSNGQTAIKASNGKEYVADEMRAVADCYDFGSGGATGTYDIQPGATETGCVHFVVPRGVTVAYVAFLPTGEWGSGQYVVWKA